MYDDLTLPRALDVHTVDILTLAAMLHETNAWCERDKKKKTPHVCGSTLNPLAKGVS